MVYDVVIVGAGFSAIGVLINLMSALPSNASVAVVADDSGFGRGTAYRTELHLHRLNVPAGRMSAFPDKPNDFLDWLNRRGRSASAASFVSRNDYGLYMRDTLASLLRPHEQRNRVTFIKSRAKSLTLGGGDIKALALADGNAVLGRNVVLCLGLGSASLPRLTFEKDVSQGQAMRRVVENPWRLGWLSEVKPNDRVCILGSGLTMVDQVLSLRNHGHRAPIEVLSRRGLLPHAHAEKHIVSMPVDINGEAMELSEILHLLRKASREAEDWRCVMEGLRHHTQDLWKQLSSEKRSRFMRHGLAWWNIHRHRLAPDVAKSLQGFLRDGSVTVRSGYWNDIVIGHDKITVAYRQRGTTSERRIEADWLVNCTGMERAGITHSPLLRSMLANNLLALDPHGLGIVVNDQSIVMRDDGNPVPGLYAVGGLTAGRFWEITAVPDIRVQVAKIAKLIGEMSDTSQH